jgi:hypothetical protein
LGRVIERCAQFALALFSRLPLLAWSAFATWLLLWLHVAFADFHWLAGFACFPRLAVLAGRTRLTLFTRLAVFTGGTLFARFALLVAITA